MAFVDLFFLFDKVGGGEDIFATIRWSQKLLYDNGQFSVEVPFRFPQFVNPLPKVFMKKEKIQLTVNSGVSKEVILQGTSHPLKVIKYLLLFADTRRTSATYNYRMTSYCNFRKKAGRVRNCLSCMKLLLRIGQPKILPSHIL